MKKLAYSLIGGLILMANTCTPETSEHCNYKGTVVDLTGLDGCGLVIERLDGQRFEVMESPEPLVAGQHLMFDYEEVEGASICMVGKLVKITCMEFIEEPEESHSCPSFTYTDLDSNLLRSTQEFQLKSYRTECFMR